MRKSPMNGKFASVVLRDPEVVGDDVVYRNSIIFKAGDYPDHGLAISPEEMAAGAILSGSIAGNIEHTDFMHGRAVFLDTAHPDDLNPWILRGDVRIPGTLHDLLIDQEKRISAEWDIKSKKLTGLALCVHPAIPEADLRSSFAKKVGTPHGKRMMQTIHDSAAASGAYCMDPTGDTDNVNASFIARHERKLFQAIHDHTKEAGAACPGSASYFSKKPSQKGKPMSLQAMFHRIFGGAPSGDELSDDEVKGIVASLVNVEAPPAKPVEKPAEVAAVADFSKNAEFVALKAKAEAVEAQNAEFSKRLLLSDACEWAESEILAKRALRKERPTMVALYIQAVKDDLADGSTARFSEEAKTLGATRLEAFKSIYSGRVPHSLFDEALVDGYPEGSREVAAAKFSTEKNGPDPAAVEKLRKMYDMLPAKKTA